MQREKQIFRFAEFELEPAERRLTAAGRAIALTPKVFDTLVLLVTNAGRVVSKDELMRALWPRGYVDESNLTKHIWLIRRALGDGEQDARFIETVPKSGYRFVAAVATDSSSSSRPTPTPATEMVRAAPTTEAAATGRASASLKPVRAIIKPWRLAAIATAFIVAVGALVSSWQSARRPAVPASAETRSIALTGFRNLSQNPKDAWLGPALMEMLGTELSTSEQLRVIPEELVLDARRGISDPEAGGYAPEPRQQLQARLHGDFLMTGSYFVTSASADALVRVDLLVQDARTGAVVAALSRQAPTSSLLSIVAEAGTALRSHLGVATPTANELAMLANAQPPSTEVARRVGFAHDALEHYDAARARDELLNAVSEAPGYAPGYLELARAWALLGFRDKAVAAAGQAASRSAGLPEERRLEVEAVLSGLSYDWSKAADAWRSLARAKPGIPEYRIQLIDALLEGGQTRAARSVLDELRRLPGAATDPRTDLAAARVASAFDDVRGAEREADQALRLAQANRFDALAADAFRALATARWHLGRYDEARQAADAAMAGYRAVESPRGEARALQVLAAVYGEQNREQDAREALQRAMSLFRSIGDQGGIGGVYRDLTGMLWTAGDRDGTQAAAREGLRIAREIGDLRLESWTLRALVQIDADEAATDQVVGALREVVALNRRSADEGGRVWSLVTLADVERLRGELTDAARDCAQATHDAATLTDPQFQMYADSTCALGAIDRGDTKLAVQALERVEHAAAAGNTVYLPNARMMLAQIDMDDGRYAEARALLTTARDGFSANESRTGEADAEAMLALCAQALGQSKERDQAVARAEELRRAMTSRQEVYVVDIALAQIRGRQERGVAIRTLEGIAADASQRHWPAWGLEARFAAWKLAVAENETAKSRRLHDGLEAEARRRGFGRILSLLRRGGAGRVS